MGYNRGGARRTKRLRRRKRLENRLALKWAGESPPQVGMEQKVKGASSAGAAKS